MKRLALTMFMGGASAACGMAAVGLALYAQGPSAMAAAQLFGAVGFVVGLVCSGLHLARHDQTALSPATLPPEALAGLVRATLANAAAERAPRAGSAADRRPEPAQGPRAATTVATTSTPTSTPTAAPTAAPQALPVAAARQFASSAFGA